MADVNEGDEYMKGTYFLEDLDMDDIKNSKEQPSSPKSAHHAMGLEAADYPDIESQEISPNKEDFGETEEEQRKGLWRSIFGYFRGPKKGVKMPAIDAKSVKEVKTAAASDGKPESL